MVANGQASVADIDRSISQGSGLRWASKGPIFAFHLAVGEGGMRPYFEKFPHDHEEPYIRLDAPELTNALRQMLTEGTAELARGSSASELAEERDRLLLRVLKVVDGGL